MKHKEVSEVCAICGCKLHREKGTYAKPTTKGRSHASEHHLVAQRFFARSANRTDKLEGIFIECPWKSKGETIVTCYECHEELLHNPVFTRNDIELFASLVKKRGLNEGDKETGRTKIAGRIKLLNEAIRKGLDMLNSENNDNIEQGNLKLLI